MLLWTALLACQEPFAFDRHDLRGLRIATLTAEVTDDEVRPEVTLVVDDQLWSDAPVDLSWGWVPQPGLAAEGFDEAATGARPVLTRQPGRLAVTASFDGASHTAELDLIRSATATPTLRVEALEQTLAEDDYRIETRVDWVPRPGRTVEPGGLLRVTVQDPPDDARARFMAIGDGTFLELDALTTDWVAGTLELDEDEVAAREPAVEGPRTVLALVLGSTAAGAARVDTFVGPAPEGAWIDGRFLPGMLEERCSGTLFLDDTSPTGMRLADAVPTTDTPTVFCGGRGLDGLATQHCTRLDLDGLTVVVEPSP